MSTYSLTACSLQVYRQNSASGSRWLGHTDRGWSDHPWNLLVDPNAPETNIGYVMLGPSTIVCPEDSFVSFYYVAGGSPNNPREENGDVRAICSDPPGEPQSLHIL